MTRKMSLGILGRDDMLTNNTSLGCTAPDRTATAGFSLFELLTVVTIAGILAALAFPSFTQQMIRERVDTMAEELSQSFTVARSAAVKSGTPAILCASGNETSCSGEWSDGWMAFIDEDRDGIYDTSESVISRTKNTSDQLEIDIENATGSNVNAVRFNYRGTPGAALTANISAGNNTATITVSSFGKTRRSD